MTSEGMSAECTVRYLASRERLATDEGAPAIRTVSELHRLCAKSPKPHINLHNQSAQASPGGPIEAGSSTMLLEVSHVCCLRLVLSRQRKKAREAKPLNWFMDMGNKWR